VDFVARRSSLERGLAPADLLDSWRDGRMKQAMIHRALEFRRRAPELFAAGAYLPLRVDGEHAERVFAFARIHEGRAAVVAVARLAAGLIDDAPAIPASRWAGTTIVLPRRLVGRGIKDVLSGTELAGGSGQLSAGEILSLPAALLELA
jgi:(1->4)-alpha-D-glucan 1-alpha-D-glucosylmutase